VDGVDLEHERHGLHVPVDRAAEAELAARAGGNIAVAGGIDNHVGQENLPPRFAFEDDTLHAVADPHGVHGHSVVEQLHAGLSQHLL